MDYKLYDVKAFHPKPLLFVTFYYSNRKATETLTLISPVTTHLLSAHPEFVSRTPKMYIVSHLPFLVIVTEFSPSLLPLKSPNPCPQGILQPRPLRVCSFDISSELGSQVKAYWGPNEKTTTSQPQ